MSLEATTIWCLVSYRIVYSDNGTIDIRYRLYFSDGVIQPSDFGLTDLWCILDHIAVLVVATLCLMDALNIIASSFRTHFSHWLGTVMDPEAFSEEQMMTGILVSRAKWVWGLARGKSPVGANTSLAHLALSVIGQTLQWSFSNVLQT